MNGTEKDIDHEIVRSLVEDLRDLPDGTRITIKNLIAESFFADNVVDDGSIDYLCKRLFSLSKQEKIILEETEDGSVIVHNEDAKYICPHCGSKNTAHIMYGLPDFSPGLIKRLDEGRLRLGGCVLSFGSGDRFCNECEKEFFTSSCGKNKQKGEAEAKGSERDPEFAIPDNIEQAESLTFTFSIVNRMTVEYQIHRISDGGILTRRRGPYLAPENGHTDEGMISETVWLDLIRRLYDEFKFHEWDPEYINNSIPEGIEWKMTVRRPGNIIQQRRGHNAHPSCWADFSELILSLFPDDRK